MLLEILKQEKKVKDMYMHTICCDEVFVQTIAYNSEFRNKIYNFENEYDGCLRELAWPSNVSGIHPGWNFSQKDLEYLLNSKRLFAMKFEASSSGTHEYDIKTFFLLFIILSSCPLYDFSSKFCFISFKSYS